MGSPEEPPENPRNRAAASLIRSAHRVEIDGAGLLWRGFTLADLAHVLMLRSTDLVPDPAARRLLAMLLDLEDSPPSEVPLVPEWGDIYRNREARLDRMDREAAGWLGVGRPRREASTIAYQITARNELLDLVGSLCDLVDALHQRSDEHGSTLIPDYTYLQRAQPTTFGHYLLGFAYPHLRDLRRVKRSFERVNRSPGGTGSTNGSRLPLDRTFLTDTLGFGGMIDHARDAMWQADVPVELLSSLTSVTLTMDRLAQDLQVFATREFDFVSLPGNLSRPSVIMPQKNNPYSLAFVRGMSAEILGRWSGTATAQKTPTGQMDNRLFPYRVVPRSIREVRRTVELMTDVVKGLEVNRKNCAQAAGEGLLGATDLAEMLMVEETISYRTAHAIVGEAVSAWTGDSSSGTKDLSFDDCLRSSAREVLGRSLSLERSTYEDRLQPGAIVASRTTPGGTASEPLGDMLGDVAERLRTVREWHTETARAVEQAEESLLARARREAGELP